MNNDNIFTIAASGAPHPPSLDWSHDGFLGSLDVARGWTVYQNVCAACHSLDQLSYRHMVGTLFTENEVKEIAAEQLIQDAEPNSAGEMFTRPGMLPDPIKRPYQNAVQAGNANNGKAPPELSLITKARHSGTDYVYSLLTNYFDAEGEPHAPHGLEMSDEQFFNPYFPGGVIGMRPPLYDGATEYEDGTDPTLSQLAKDVTTFLHWSAEPEQDQRKKIGASTLMLLGVATFASLYLKRFKFNVVKNRTYGFQEGFKK